MKISFHEKACCAPYLLFRALLIFHPKKLVYRNEGFEIHQLNNITAFAPFIRLTSRIKI